VSRNLGSDKAKIHGNTNFDTPKLVVGVSCAHISSLLAIGVVLAQSPTGKYD
jgi:hypothetical protein